MKTPSLKTPKLTQPEPANAFGDSYEALSSDAAPAPGTEFSSDPRSVGTVQDGARRPTTFSEMQRPNVGFTIGNGVPTYHPSGFKLACGRPERDHVQDARTAAQDEWNALAAANAKPTGGK